MLIIIVVIISVGVGTSYASLHSSISRPPSCISGCDVDFTGVSIVDNEIEKDVAKTCACIYCGETIEVTIVHAYPGYEASLYFTITNIGTKLVYIHNVSINAYDEAEVEIVVSPLVGIWLRPGDAITGELTVLVLNGAQLDSSYLFHVDIHTCCYQTWHPHPPWFF